MIGAVGSTPVISPPLIVAHLVRNPEPAFSPTAMVIAVIVAGIVTKDDQRETKSSAPL